jgi:hypothetical protein
MALSLTKRNIFEVSVVLFVICMASELRSAGKREMAQKNVRRLFDSLA